MAMLIVVTLVLIAAVTLLNYVDKKNGNVSAQTKGSAAPTTDVRRLTPSQVKEQTVIIKELITNLAEKNKIMKASFAFELSNKKAKEEFENYDFKAKGIINQTLADLTVEQVSGGKGQEYLKSLLMTKLNELLSEGKIMTIYITEMIIQ